MWKFRFTVIFSIISCIICDSNETAKVEEVDRKDSSINYIKYTNNGLFNAQNQNQTSVSYIQPIIPINQCGGIFRNLQNLIESPKFVSPRPICNLRCDYQIISPYICENEFHVQFLDFEIDSSRNCEKDRVIINHFDVICGKIIGVKKFRTQNGALNITFTSTNWDGRDGRGYKMLVTRLPCVENSKEDQSEVDALEPSGPGIVDNEHRCFQVNSSINVQNPIYRDRPIYGVPVNRNYSVNGRQDIPVIPLPTPPYYPQTTPETPVYPQPPIEPPTYPLYPIQPPVYPQPQPPIYPQPQPPVQPPYYPQPPVQPPFYPQPPVQPPYFPQPPAFPRPPVYPQPPVGPGGILPPQFLPQCCRNNYNQNRFLLISQGFPAYFLKNNDCTFVIQRSSPNVCKLKIVFKYFLLEDGQQGGCINNFVEIDGQRICGCKTNFIYETLWGFEPKVIRMRTISGQFASPQGFVLDVIQEACPFKIQQNPPQQRNKRFIFHKLLKKNHGDFDVIPALTQIKTDIDEKFKSKFFEPDRNNFINNVCLMNHLKLFQMKLETIGIPKQYCFPSLY